MDTNETSSEKTSATFDLIVIGGGPGGYVAAIRAAQLGLRCALVEKRGTLGGTCLNVGCIPSKALLESSALFHEVQAGLGRHGIHTGPPELDLAAMMARKHAVVRDVTSGLDVLMKKNRIRVFTGEGSLVAPGSVLVATQSGPVILQAPEVILATGSVAVELPFLPFDGRYVVSSTEALSFETVPEHLVVVGAGAVGLELGSVWRRLGAQVTVVEMLPQITPFADRFVAGILAKALKKQGLDIRLECRVRGATIQGDARWPVVVAVEDRKGVAGELPCDRVLVAVGRRAFTSGLGLANLDLEVDPAGKIPVDAHFRVLPPTDGAPVPGLRAIGDVIVGPMLAHKAEEEGIAVAADVAGHPSHVAYDTIPSVVYTEPELASVGLSEEQAAAQGLAVKTGRVWLKANARARTMEAEDGLYKVIADADTDRILGVHIVAPHASELVAEATLALGLGARTADLARTVHAHPTLAEGVKEAVLAVDRRSIHG